SAKQRPLQPPPRYALATRACAREASVGQPSVGRAEQILSEQLAGGGLLIPQHHQHDELELIERQRGAASGERALEHELARLRRKHARLLESDEKAAAFGIEL